MRDSGWILVDECCVAFQGFAFDDQRIHNGVRVGIAHAHAAHELLLFGQVQIRADDAVIASESSLRAGIDAAPPGRSEEHTSELQSLMRISYAVFCLKKKKIQETTTQRRYNKR